MKDLFIYTVWLSIIAIIISLGTLAYIVTSDNTDFETIENDYDDSKILSFISALEDKATVAVLDIIDMRGDIDKFRGLDAESRLQIGRNGNDIEDLEDDFDDLEDDFDDLEDDTLVNSDLNPLRSDITNNQQDIALINSCAGSWNVTEDDLEDFIVCLTS